MKRYSICAFPGLKGRESNLIVVAFLIAAWWALFHEEARIIDRFTGRHFVFLFFE